MAMNRFVQLKQAFADQARILAPDIGQCPAKNRDMSDESCFTTDTVIRREVRIF